jgi:hypothetical protein
MDNDVNLTKLVGWLVLAVVFGVLADRYFQGYLYWPAKAATQTTEPSQTPVKIIEIGFVLVTAFSLYMAAGTRLRTQHARIATVAAVAIVVGAIVIMYALANLIAV